MRKGLLKSTLDFGPRTSDIAQVLLLSSMLICINLTCANASVRSDVAQGNKAYKQGNYNKAFQQYITAQVKTPHNYRISNNTGLALYKEDRFVEARNNFTKALSEPKVPSSSKSIINYNLGNTFYKKQEYDKAIASYKAAIDQDNRNIDARYNLGIARKKQKEQQKQQQPAALKKPKGSDKDKDNKKPQGNNNQNDQPDKKDDQQKQQEQNRKNDGDMRKEEARQLLDMVAREEERNPVRIRGEFKGDKHVEKDW